MVYDNVELKIGPTDIVYITGDSGSGKSVLLKAIKQDLVEEATDMAARTPKEALRIAETLLKLGFNV